MFAATSSLATSQEYAAVETLRLTSPSPVICSVSINLEILILMAESDLVTMCQYSSLLYPK